jgi:anti-sigma factor RsiW
MGMTCWSIKRRIVDYVDGRLRGGELTRFENHLSECRECELRVNEVRSVRSSLRGLPPVEIPSDLRVRLRVKASQERVVLLQTNGSRLLRAWNVWKFRLNEMMRPLTIPATGGFVSALALFGMFALTISTTTHIVTEDVPISLFTEHINANLVPMELRTSVVVVTFSTDGSGRITDYAFREGSKSVVGGTARLQSNIISLPDIPSVMTAQPISSNIRISFTPIVFRR